MEIIEDQADERPLGIYLNDHYAGSVAGTALANRMARAAHRARHGEELRKLATELEEDQVWLRRMMGALGVPVRHYKIWGAWLAEKIGRLKLNGYLVSRSPLASVVELEALRVAVEGKAAGWRTLRAIADHDTRLDTARLDTLLERARLQATTVEELRGHIAKIVFLPSRGRSRP